MPNHNTDVEEETFKNTVFETPCYIFTYILKTVEHFYKFLMVRFSDILYNWDLNEMGSRYHKLHLFFIALCLRIC